MSQSIDVFRTMTSEECNKFFQVMRDDLRPLYRQAEVVAAAALRVRPVFLGKQQFPKRCEMMRKALSLRINADATSELLATFFMEKYAKDLGELLDSFKIEHEEGALKGPSPAEPDEKTIRSVTEKFQGGPDATMRRLLLKAFAAQSAIEWPKLDRLVFGEAVEVKAAPPPAAKRGAPPSEPSAKASKVVASRAEVGENVKSPAAKSTAKAKPAAEAKNKPLPESKAAPVKAESKSSAKAAPTKAESKSSAKSSPAKAEAKSPAKSAPAKATSGTKAKKGTKS